MSDIRSPHEADAFVVLMMENRSFGRHGGWQEHAIQTSTPGAALTLRYVGGSRTG